MSVKHSKPRRVPHCMVLPRGNFNSMIPKPFAAVCPERFMMVAVTVMLLKQIP